MPILDVNNKDDLKKYNEYINSSKYARLTQAIDWGNVKSNWKKEIVYLEKDGKITASMLILIQSMKLGGYTMLYSPRGPVCDVNDIDTVNSLIKESEHLVKKYKACMIKFDPQVEYSDELNKKYINNGYKTSGKNPDHDELIQPVHEAVLKLNGESFDELMKGFAEKTRYNIRLSGRKGVTVRYSHTEEDLKVFYNLYEITTVRDKIGRRAYSYFKDMLDAYDENHLRIYVTSHDGVDLSAAIAICYGPEMFYLYGASSNEKRNLMPNYMMQAEMIKWAIEKGCSLYNFGGILHLDKNNGLYKFKVGFCKEEGITNYIGEIDKVHNKPIYFLYKYVFPIFKKVRRKVRKILKKQ